MYAPHDDNERYSLTEWLDLKAKPPLSKKSLFPYHLIQGAAHLQGNLLFCDLHCGLSEPFTFPIKLPAEQSQPVCYWQLPKTAVLKLPHSQSKLFLTQPDLQPANWLKAQRCDAPRAW